MSTPTSVFNVAAYIADAFKASLIPLSAMKLQKLLYYCQAWSLVWNEVPLFVEEIEAWANGPVVKALYEVQKGIFQIDSVPQGDASCLSECQVEAINQVIDCYGDKTAQWLSDLTHLEAPWREARIGLNDGERGSNVISLGAIHEYYSSLDANQNCL
jgi:uncharacterized phage-associated protein